jgi:Bifunctional DNA primase/polymerase, N-terminal
MTAADAARALDVALGLGVPAFPCRSDKAPTCPHGFRDATANPLGLRDLWRRHPGPLVGVPTGEASGIDVLDIDAPRHPEAANWFAARRDRLPETRIHRTRSGGLHVLFRHAGGLRSWAGRPVPGVDGRADGGHVVWWPVDGLPIRSPGPPAPFPRWLIQAPACAIKKHHARSAAQFERAERSGDPGALERFVALITRHSQPPGSLLGGGPRWREWYSQCRGRAVQAAMASGLDAIEAIRTVRSGIARGARDGRRGER